MPLTPLEILKAREERHWPEIMAQAEEFYNDYTVDGEREWRLLSESERLPWYLAAERQLTALRISRREFAGRRLDSLDQHR